MSSADVEDIQTEKAPTAKAARRRAPSKTEAGESKAPGTGASARKPAAPRKAAPKKAPAKAPPSKKRAAPAARSIPVSPEERWKLIASTAYFKAQSRGFAPGGEETDWLEAEREIDAMLRTGD